MNKFQKLAALYRNEGITKAFFQKAWAGVCRIVGRVSKRIHVFLRRKLFGTSDTAALSAYDVHWNNPNVPHGDKVLYLTFDTEWEKPENVDLILDVLKEKQVPATFFLLGEKMAEHIRYVKRIRAEGHTVGNHTMTHPALTKCTRREIQRELSQCAELYHELTGEVMPKIMRPPYGRIDVLTAKQLHKLGYQSFLWNMHVYDWKKEEPATWEVFKAYLDTDLKTGAIILQHSFSDETTAHIDKYIDYCRAKGYRFAPLSEFLAD